MDKNIVGNRYVLAVNDLEAAVEYYESKLGLRTVSQYPGWAFLARESFFVMLGECQDERSAREIGNHSYFAYVDVIDANSLYEEYKSKNVEFIKTVTDELWGMREFGVKTLDGHRIMFGESLEK